MSGLIVSVLHDNFDTVENVPLSEYLEKFDIAYHIVSPTFRTALPTKTGIDDFEELLIFKAKNEKRGLL